MRDARAARQAPEVALDEAHGRVQDGGWMAAQLYLPVAPGEDEAEVAVAV